MQPFGQGWAFLPFNKHVGYFRAKMPTPALMAAYFFMRKTSSSCRATNYIQFFSLLQSFFSVYIHHISVILLNKRTLSPLFIKSWRLAGHNRPDFCADFFLCCAAKEAHCSFLNNVRASQVSLFLTLSYATSTGFCFG